eukprot:6173308-Pleurochrysis_carterae.AAC.2
MRFAQAKPRKRVLLGCGPALWRVWSQQPLRRRGAAPRRFGLAHAFCRSPPSGPHASQSAHHLSLRDWEQP